MNYFILNLIIVGFVLIAYWYIGYLKATRGTEGYAKRKAIGLLFLGFMALIGITTVFADALFELLGLSKPAHFEWISFGAYIVFAIAAVRIMQPDNGKAQQTPTTVKQTNTAGGDNVAGDKIGGDKVMGDKIENHYTNKKKMIPKN